MATLVILHVMVSLLNSYPPPPPFFLVLPSHFLPFPSSLLPLPLPPPPFSSLTPTTTLIRRNLDYQEVLDALAQKGISIRVASPKLVMEEVMMLPPNTLIRQGVYVGRASCLSWK